MAKEVNQGLAREFGLSADEYKRVLGIARNTGAAAAAPPYARAARMSEVVLHG